MRQFLPLRVMLYLEPLPAVYSVPKVQAHLSAFSSPRVSYQAFRSGSVVASSNSCATIDAMPSPPASPLGLVVCADQAERQRAGLPMNAYLMSLPLIVPCVCQPQYWVQKPEVSFTSAEVNTMYTADVLLGTLPELIALATMVWIEASLNEVPCE